MPSNPRVGNYEYSQHSQHSQQGQTPIPPPYQRPQQIHTNYPQSRHSRSEMVADEDELWRQRSRQQSDEMAAAVIRARQRREEDEKKIEMSRQAAHEKLKALEEKSVDKESSEFDERSRHSSESRDEKLSGRDSRDTRSANYANSFAAPKQYPKNVPPRFQKQAELMRQQQTNQTTQSPPYEQRLTHPLSRLSQDNDQRIAVSNSSQLLNKTPLLADSSRSDSQISSGHESYDSERQTPEFDAVCSKDKRQKQQSAIDNNWRSTQTQRLQTNECKDLSENSRPNETHDNIDKSNQISQRDLAKRLNEEPTQIVSKTDFSTQKIRPEIKDTKPRDDTIDREIIVEKRNLIERQESSQSSQSDKRSSSSKEERFTKKYERLDWASECDNVSISSYGKRERHRHVPITQKQFESITEPIKKNFTPLKKNNSSIITSNDTPKDSSVDKSADNLKKSQTPPPTQSVISTDKSNPSTNNATDVSKIQTLKEETHVEVGSKKVRDDDRHYDRSYNRDKDRVRQESAKEDKSTRKSNSNRYDSYQNRGRYSGATYRGHNREYRRTRGSSEKSSYLDSKLPSNPGHSRSKNNKSRRKSNSDESFVSEEQNKKESLKIEDKSIINPISATNVIKETKTDEDKEKSSALEPTVSSVSSSTLPNQRSDPSRRGRGAVAFKNSTRGLPRTYGPSNYGPPPSRAAFGDGSVKSDVNRNLDQNRNERNYDSRNYDSRNSNDFHQTRDNSSKSNKEDSHLASFSNSQTNKISHDNNRNSIAHNRKVVISGNRGSNNSGANSSANNRSEQIPPRFQKRHNNGSQRGGRSRNWNERSRSSNANQVESDVTNNEEWETASESSDIAERNDRKSHKKSNYSEPRNDNRNYNRKSEKRNDYPRGQHSSGSQSSNFRGRHRNSGTNSISTTRGANANNISANQRRNGPLNNSNLTNDNITVCSLSDVTLDNPTAVEDAMIDIKSRAKLSDEYNDELLNNSENEDGFQTVSYKKRNRVNPGNNSKKLKQEVNSNFLYFKF
jgi:hypothetical protein